MQTNQKNKRMTARRLPVELWPKKPMSELATKYRKFDPLHQTPNSSAAPAGAAAAASDGDAHADEKFSNRKRRASATPSSHADKKHKPDSDSKWRQ